MDHSQIKIDGAKINGDWINSAELAKLQKLVDDGEIVNLNCNAVTHYMGYEIYWAD